MGEVTTLREAANLARATHAPDCVLVYESGTIGAKPGVLPEAANEEQQVLRELRERAKAAREEAAK